MEIITNTDKGNKFIEKINRNFSGFGGSVAGQSSLPISGLVNKNRTQNWLETDDSTTLCTSVMLPPYDGCKLTFRLTDNLVAYVRYGDVTGSSSLSSALHDGDSFTIPKHKANICIIIRNVNLSNIDASEVNALVASNDVSVMYDDMTNVVQRNIGCEVYVKAAMYKALATASKSYLHNIPVFAHISDIHGDLVRMQNAIEYCNYLGVDAIINTGDTVCRKGSDGFATYNAMSTMQSTPILVCVGNHDGWYVDYGNKTQNEKMYDELISPNAIAFGYTMPLSAQYDEAPTYYYKDFDNWKIRIISLNEFESNLKEWAYVGRISQKQIDWFISTLLSTPEGYGVMLMYHAMMFPVDKLNDYAKFYNVTGGVGSYGTIKYLNGDPIGKIVDAFIAKESISGSYTQAKKDGTTETISFVADFTSLNNDVEFICHLNGHTHCDYIGLYHGVTQHQLVLSITTGQSIYGFAHYSKANNDELPRGGQGAVSDAFNIYAIDRDAGKVRVARVGANMTSNFDMRDFMEIPYK